MSGGATVSSGPLRQFAMSPALVLVQPERRVVVVGGGGKGMGAAAANSDANFRLAVAEVVLLLGGRRYHPLVPQCLVGGHAFPGVPPTEIFFTHLIAHTCTRRVLTRDTSI